MDENNQNLTPGNSPEQKSSLSPMKLGLIVYVGGLLFMYLGYTFLSGSLAGNVLFFGYFIIGFLLNRIVLRQLEWHHMHNTLANVAKAKLTSLLFWPFSYLVLFVTLFINRVL